MPIPNIESSPTYDGQSVTDATDLAALAATNTAAVLSGCVISTASGMTVQTSTGAIYVNGASVGVNAASVTIATASSNDRRDILVANASGSVYAVAGTPCTTAGWTRNSYPALPPVKSGIPASTVYLGEVYVAGGASVVISGAILNTTSSPGTETNYVQTAGGSTIIVDSGGTSQTGIAFQFSASATPGASAQEIFDHNGAPIAAINNTGGWKVFGDRLQAGGIFGPFMALDGTTHPPSVLFPSTAYGAGGRLWASASTPATGWSAGTTRINDLWYDYSNGLMYTCTVSGGASVSGTWVPWPKLPPSDPHVAGQMWASGSVAAVSLG